MNKFTLIFIIGLLSYGGNGLLSAYHGIPVPYVHDEFSYLLAADTFAHGRITNPTPPMWQHFETFHVLLQPTYMSKYPPGQGFFMALGQILWGHPIYGVWLSSSLMCMAICWMLFAWVPAYWAFVGGVVSVIEFGVFTYWSQSYWGGAVAALGGALVFGALPRIFRFQRLRDVIWLGLGLAILVNSRPLEGILMAIPVGCLVLPWKIKWETIKNFHFVKKIVLPFILALLTIIIGVGSYNKAMTGKVFVFPNTAYSNNYMASPMFIWEPLRPMPQLRHQVFRNFEGQYAIKYYSLKRTWKGFWDHEIDDIWAILNFYFIYPLAVPVLFFLSRVLNNRERVFKALFAILILACACAAAPWEAKAHYFSPTTCLVVLIVVLGLRTLAGLSRQTGMKLVYIFIAAQVMINIVDYRQFELNSYGVPEYRYGMGREHYSREELSDLLTQNRGKYLVLVKEEQNLFFNNEWVYNGANIDQQPIVWARSMGEQEDAKLLAYYNDRQVLRIIVDRENDLSTRLYSLQR